jgi:hypothetical protein
MTVLARAWSRPSLSALCSHSGPGESAYRHEGRPRRTSPVAAGATYVPDGSGSLGHVDRTRCMADLSAGVTVSS